MKQEQKPVIELKNVNKYYGEHHVLKDINLSVQTGEGAIRVREIYAVPHNQPPGND